MINTECLTCKKHYTQGGHCKKNIKNCNMYVPEPRGKMIRKKVQVDFGSPHGTDNQIYKVGSKVTIEDRGREIKAVCVNIYSVDFRDNKCSMLVQYHEGEEPKSNQIDNPLPKEFREMRAYEKIKPRDQKSFIWLFFQQAKYMEDFEDDYNYNGILQNHAPVYSSMTNEELRGYFTWRTKYRHGVPAATNETFIRLYIHEIINGIGVPSTESGYQMLKKAGKLLCSCAYYEWDRERYPQDMNKILNDYVIYHGLPQKFLNYIYQPADYYKKISSLADYNKLSKDDLFYLVLSITPKKKESDFKYQYLEDFKNITYKVLTRLFEDHDMHPWKTYLKYRRRQGINEWPMTMFSGSTDSNLSFFKYEERKHDDCVYIVDVCLSYHCINGEWKSLNYDIGKILATILRTIESRMREYYHWETPLAHAGNETLLTLIDDEIERYLSQERKTTAEQINIDLSKLQGIREAAIRTGDKLIADEEITEKSPVSGRTNSAVKKEASSKPMSISEPQTSLDTAGESIANGLTELQTRFLQCLLDDIPYADLLRRNGVLPSVLVDEINEVLFDEFGDTVIEYIDDSPKPVEDYEPELRDLIKG